MLDASGVRKTGFCKCFPAEVDGEKTERPSSQGPPIFTRRDEMDREFSSDGRNPFRTNPPTEGQESVGGH